MNKLSPYAPVVLRLGLAAVFIWFGTSQILSQSAWVGLIPAWVVNMSGLSASTIVIMNGVFEVIMAVALVFGFGIRIASALLFLHLISIIMDVGLTSVGIRDIGLMFGMLAVFLHGNDIFSISS